MSKTVTDNTLILRACTFAAQKHKSQKRKDKEGTPYINHPLEVANLIAESGVTDVEILIAAILHDTLEDTQTTREEICDLFGLRVLMLVVECSDDKTLPKEVRKQQQIEHATDMYKDAKYIKLADKYSNVSDVLANPPAKWSNEQVQGYVYWAYAVWLKLKGFSAWFDSRFNRLFAKAGLVDVSEKDLDEKLTAYYNLIK